MYNIRFIVVGYYLFSKVQTLEGPNSNSDLANIDICLGI